MTVAIIGSGKMGSGMVRLLASSGIEVAIGHRDPAKDGALPQEIGPNAKGGGTAAAVKLADVVLLATPYGAAAEEIQKLVRKARVVKAFKTIFAELLALEARRGRAAPVQVFIAGDDAVAKETVSRIVAKAGFEPVESGALSNARYLDPVGEMNIHFGFFLSSAGAPPPRRAGSRRPERPRGQQLAV